MNLQLVVDNTKLAHLRLMHCLDPVCPFRAFGTTEDHAKQKLERHLSAFHPERVSVHDPRPSGSGEAA